MGDWTLMIEGRPEDHPNEQAVLQRIQDLLHDALRNAQVDDLTVKDAQGRRYEVHLDVRLVSSES